MAGLCVNPAVSLPVHRRRSLWGSGVLDTGWTQQIGDFLDQCSIFSAGKKKVVIGSRPCVLGERSRAGGSSSLWSSLSNGIYWSLLQESLCLLPWAGGVLKGHPSKSLACSVPQRVSLTLSWPPRGPSQFLWCPCKMLLPLFCSQSFRESCTDGLQSSH